MARKTLVIGLGTTGSAVCNNLIERLEWEYGHIRRTPWIKFLSIETALTGNQAVERTENVVHLPVQRNSRLLEVQENPTRWETLFQPQKWLHPALSSAIRNIGGDGAGNLRQAGRLALLYPDYLSNVVSGVQTRVQALGALTEPTAQRAFNGVPDDPDYPPREPLPGELPLTLAQDPSQHVSPIDIYVIGSLCGGTASGTFIDLPYIIRHLVPVYRMENMKLVGIFAGYPPDGTVAELGANTYHALREYHHWASDEITFHAQYNGMAIADSRKPYDEFHVVTPVTEHRPDIERLCGAIADYLYIRTFSPDADAVDGRRADFGNGYNTASPNGQQQNFATFGISGIEYPARRLVEACQLTLITKAFTRLHSEWSQDPRNKDSIGALAGNELRSMNALGTGLLGSLLTSETGQRNVLERVKEHVEAVAQRGAAKLSQLDECDAQIEVAMGLHPSDSPPPVPGLEPGVVKTSITRNRAELAGQLRKQLAESLRKRWLQPDLGPEFCRAFVEAALKAVEDELKRFRPDAKTGLTEVQTQAEAEKQWKESLRWELTDTQRNTALGVLFSKGWAMRQLLEEWTACTQKYYELRIQEVQQDAIRELLGLLREDLQRYRDRLLPEAFASSYLRKTQETMETALRDAMRRPYLSNYQLLAAVNQETVDAEYQSAFEDPNDAQDAWRTRERDAQVPVLRAFEDLAEAVFSTPDTPVEVQALLPRGSAAMQPNLELRPEHQQAMMARSRVPFTPIERRHVLERFRGLGDAEGQRVVNAMLTASRPMLRLHTDDGTRFEDLPMKHAGFVFFNGHRSCLDPNAPDASSEALGFRRKLPQDGDETTGRESNERHRVTAIREQTAFPLGIVEGYLESGRLVHLARTAPPRATYASRSDVVTWLPVERDAAAQEVVQLFVVLVALREIDAGQDPLVLMIEQQDAPVEFSRNLREIEIQFSGEVPIKDAVRVDMLNRIYRFKEREGVTEMVTRLNNFVIHAHEFGLLQQEGMEMDRQVARGWVEEYVNANPDLRPRWQTLNPRPQIDLGMLFRRQGEVVLARFPLRVAQADGYYCDNCGYRFGKDMQAVAEKGKCVRCRKMFIYQ